MRLSLKWDQLWGTRTIRGIRVRRFLYHSSAGIPVNFRKNVLTVFFSQSVVLSGSHSVSHWNFQIQCGKSGRVWRLETRSSCRLGSQLVIINGTVCEGLSNKNLAWKNSKLPDFSSNIDSVRSHWKVSAFSAKGRNDRFAFHPNPSYFPASTLMMASSCVQLAPVNVHLWSPAVGHCLWSSRFRRPYLPGFRNQRARSKNSVLKTEFFVYLEHTLCFENWVLSDFYLIFIWFLSEFYLIFIWFFWVAHKLVFWDLWNWFFCIS